MLPDLASSSFVLNNDRTKLQVLAYLPKRDKLLPNYICPLENSGLPYNLAQNWG